VASPWANIVPSSQVGGIYYCQNVVLPSFEADLGVPVSLIYHRALTAVVELTPVNVSVNTSYVVLQTDVGDGVWCDVCGAGFSSTTGVTFFFDASVQNANTVVQQTRAQGTPPSPLAGSNPISLGARFRFTGQANLTGSSSSASSATSSTSSGGGVYILATVRYHLTGLR
jgi:hypothetical protein